MILVFLTTLLLVEADARAEDFDNTPSDITYEQNAETLNKDYPAILDKYFSNLNFEVLEGRNDIAPSAPLDWLNKIYVTTNYGKGDARVVFAKSGIDIKGPVEFNKIYSHPKGFIVHYKVDESTTVLFFRNFPKDSISKYSSDIVQYLKQSGDKKSTAKNWHRMNRFNKIFQEFFISSAFAETTTSLSNICSISLNGDIPKTDASAIGQMWNCTKGFGSGVWNATGGTVWFVAKGSYNLIVNPVETFSKVSNEFDTVIAAMNDFEGAFGELKSAFIQLPNEVKWKIGCEVFSSIGTSAAIAYLTAGAGSPILLRAIAQALNKVAGALPKGSTSLKLTEMAKGMTDKAKNAEEMVSKIAYIKSGKELKDASDRYVDLTKKRRNAQVLLEEAKRKEANAHHHVLRALSEKKSKTVVDQIRKERSVAEDRVSSAVNAVYNASRAEEKARLNLYNARMTSRSKEFEDQLKTSTGAKVAVGTYFAAAGCNTLSSIDVESVPKAKATK